MIDNIRQVVTGWPPELAVFVVALLPIVELRGAIPLGLALGLPLPEVFALSLLGSLVPAPVIMRILEPLAGCLRQRPVSRRFVGYLLSRSQARADQVRRLGYWGLVILVAVPLPSTGTWTAAAAASVLGLRLGRAMLAIAAGAVLAGAIVTGLVLLGRAPLGL